MKKTVSNRNHDLIEKSAEIYQSIIRDSMDGFWMIDMKGRFLDVNDTYCRLIGYSRKDLLKMNILEVMVKQTSKDIIRVLKRVKKSEKERGAS